MPNDDQNTPTEVPTKLVAIAMFGGGSRNYLRMSLLTLPGKMPRPVYHLALMPSPDASLPAQHMSFEDLTMLKALIDSAIKEGIAMTTMVFQEAPKEEP